MPTNESTSDALLSPVADVDTGSTHKGPEPGIGLCLSGGGYRAMLFHAGVLIRLNEAGLLSKLDRISSVSGGSIIAGLLGLKWSALNFDGTGVAGPLVEEVIEPIRRLARHTIDVGSVLTGALGPGSISNRVTNAYRKHLFGSATLQDLPDKPRLVINATNVQSGVLWRFMKPYMRDYRVGEVRSPAVKLAVAVTASSAFPPFLSPLNLEVDPTTYTPGSGQDLQYEPYTSNLVLTDGGVYDNLGLETVWKRYDTVLVSDGGGKMAPEPEPKGDWVRHARRVMDLVDNQVRSLRKRQVIGSFKSKERTGAYWGIRSKISNYGLPDVLPCPYDKSLHLANTPTRLKRLPDDLQEQLINWGYAVCDAALRRHYVTNLAVPSSFPYPGGIG
jgi:NTE family protein